MTKDLEEAFLADGNEGNNNTLLPDLIVRLLQGCDLLQNRESITTSNYQMFLRRYLRQKCQVSMIDMK